MQGTCRCEYTTESDDRNKSTHVYDTSPIFVPKT